MGGSYSDLDLGKFWHLFVEVSFRVGDRKVDASGH